MNTITRYTIKFFALAIIISLIFKFMLNKPTFDSILLGMIITIALFCIENILELNQTVSNPADCSQCQISNEGFANVVVADTANGAKPATIPQLDQKATQEIVDTKIKNGENLDNEYTKYDTSQLHKIENDEVKKANEFRMSIGNPALTQNYLQDGKAFYDKLYTDSTNAPLANELINNELAYGNYNYIGPLNRGMINPAYTYIAPSNWYPIPPHPPVCVTSNKGPVTAIVNNDGTNNLMNFANLGDFDKTSRFTGNMNINLEYIKKFLNNGEGCN